MKGFSRTDRVSELIHREVAAIIDHDLKDTNIGMVTVTGAEVSKDLRNAKIFISVLGDENQVETSLEALNGAASYIRTCLKSRVILKYLPSLRFYYDSSMVDGMRMDKILNDIHRES